MIGQLFSGSTAQVLALLGLILPHLSSLATGSRWLPTWAGGYVTLFFSALIGFVGQWTAAPNPHGYDWRHAASIAAFTFILAILSRLGVHRQTPIADALEANLVGNVWTTEPVDAASLVAPKHRPLPHP